MNWITKILKASEKIKTAIKRRASKEEIKNFKKNHFTELKKVKNDLLNNTFRKIKVVN